MTKIVRTQPAKAGQQITVTDAQNRSFQAEAVGDIIDNKGVAFQVDGQWKVAGNSNQTQQSRNQLDRHTPKKKSAVTLYPFIRLYLANFQGYKDGDGYKGVKTSQTLLFVLGGVNLGKGRTKYIVIGVDNSGNYYLGNVNIMPTLSEIQSAILGSQNYYYLGSRFLKPKSSNNLIVYPNPLKNSRLEDLRLNRFSAYSASFTQTTLNENDSDVWFNYSYSLEIDNTYEDVQNIQGIVSGEVECEPTWFEDPIPNFAVGFALTTPYSRERVINSSRARILSTEYTYNIVSQLLSDNSSTVTGVVTITESGDSNYSFNLSALISGYNVPVTTISVNQSFEYESDEMPYTLNYLRTVTEIIEVQLPDQAISLNNVVVLTITESGNYSIVSQNQTSVIIDSDTNIENRRQYDGEDIKNTNYNHNETYYDVILVFNQQNYILFKKERKGVLAVIETVDYGTSQGFLRTSCIFSVQTNANRPPSFSSYYTAWYLDLGDSTIIRSRFNNDNPFLSFTSALSVTNSLEKGYVNYETLTVESQISEIKIGNTVIDTTNDFCLFSSGNYNLVLGENVITLTDSNFPFIGNQQSRTIYTAFSNGDEDWFFNNTLPVLIYSNEILGVGTITGLTFQDYSFNGNVYKRKVLTVTVNITSFSTDYCAAEYLDGTVIFTPNKCFNFVRSILEYKKSQESLIHLGLGFGKKININGVMKDVPTIYIAEQADESVKQKKNIKVDVYRLNGNNFSRYPNQKGDIGKREKTPNSNSEFWLYYD